MNVLDYFTVPGPMTDPGVHAALLDPLSSEIHGLGRVVQGLMIHIFWAEQYGVKLPAPRKEEVQLRLVAAQLARLLELDPRPLANTRPPDRRLVGNCRDFSVLLTAILRHKGVPARARCGFARYFLPNHYEDHWVCEYWHAAQGRWVLVDAQLDELQRDKLSIHFDPCDVPRDQFIVGGKAWRMCRAGQADPDAFGIFDMHGLGFVRGDFVRDVASLNRMELLPWDCWGIIEAKEEDLTPDDLALLDETAVLVEDDALLEFNRVRGVYVNDSRLRVPPTIRSYTPGGPKAVDLPQTLQE